MKPFLILALDPGVTSGYAYGEVSNTGEFRFVGCGEAKFHEHELYGMLVSIDPLYLVAESFEFRQSQTGIVLDSRDMLGVCKMWTALHHRNYRTQSASSGKAYFDNDKLKKHGVYAKGMGHARDATRHILHFVTFGEGNQWLRKDGSFG